MSMAQIQQLGLPASLPHWVPQLLWSLGTIAAAYLVGHLIKRFIAPRLVLLASRTKGEWDDVIIDEIQRRVPWWSLLIGAWLALGHWPALGADSTALDLAHKFLFVVAGLSVTAACVATTSRLVRLYGAILAPGLPLTGLTQNLLTIFVSIVGGLVVLRGIGVEITPMLTAMGVGGLAVALALQEPLGNLFAGFFLSMAGHIRVGDFIRLENGLDGYVVDFNWRSARIRQLANNIIIVPNLKLSQATVLNFQLPDQGLSVPVQLGVDYASDLAHVERVTTEVGREVMKEVEGGVPDHDPFILYSEFGDSSINFTVILRGREYVSQYLVKHEFIKRLHARYKTEGIEIPFPQRTLSTRGPLPIATSGGIRSDGE
ncbi:MAG: mechanosensitive ion channel family protein [Acidobacteria bacterium]|nr:mechanosensitive ion channel family protein [Acidobacteriota bacterium]